MWPKTKFTPAYLMLIPAPWLGMDFMSTWFIFYLSLSLVLISCFKLHKSLALLNIIPLGLHLSERALNFSPELTVPVLGNTLISLFLVNKANRKFDMYPYFLWIGAFALFSSGFYYLIYILFTTLYILFQLSQKSTLDLKGLWHVIVKNRNQFLITLISTVLLFIFFPRFHNFLPSVNQNKAGEIGYSKSISNSTTSNLNQSSKTAFYAEIDKKLPPEELYWRGRIHQKTDGYNWSHIRPTPTRSTFKYAADTVLQKIKFEQGMDGDLILLDRAKKVMTTNLNVHRLRSTHEFRTTFLNKKSYITAVSTLTAPEIALTPKDLAPYLKLPKLNNKLLIKFLDDISSQRPKGVINQFKYKIINEKFSYSLKPGFLPTMNTFLQKKVGYCSHFASLLGITLRSKGIPARLVSGFQGGQYNEVSNHYEVKSNDAHAWVEYFDEKRWKRIDPTEFISPNRILLGGEAYLNPNLLNGQRNKSNFLLKFVGTITQRLEAINYKVSLLVDNYDRSTQRNIAKFLKLNFKTFLAFGLGTLFLLFLIYYFAIKKWPQRKSIHKADKILMKLNKKLKKYHIKFSPQLPIAYMKELTKEHPKKDQLTDILNIYQLYKYGMQDKSSELKEKVSQF